MNDKNLPLPLGLPPAPIGQHHTRVPQPTTILSAFLTWVLPGIEVHHLSIFYFFQFLIGLLDNGS